MVDPSEKGALSIGVDHSDGAAKQFRRSGAVSRDAEARFTRGSILRHTLVMTATGTVGTLSIFAVDLLSLVYVSRLGRTELKAAVGFATQVLVYPIAINIGLTIAITAAVSRALGAKQMPHARHIAATGLVISAIVSAFVALLAFAGSEPLLALFGAKGETRDIAHRYLTITLPGNVPFALGMALSGILRAVGDARRAMFVTLGGGVVVAMLDPLLIFGFDLGIDGAAISTLVSRFVFLAIGLYGAWKVHGLIEAPRRRALGLDFKILATVALPAILTNLATPFANGFALHVYAGYGNDAVAASAVIDRTIYVAFAAIFALTGAVGPILGQNLGAGRFDRVRETLTCCFVVTTLYALAVWLVLALTWPEIASLFRLSATAADYVAFFCTAGVSAWLFISLLFVANAAFNNLGFSVLSMGFNWGRATFGTLPFVSLGAWVGGVKGGQLGVTVGAALFGTGAVVVAYRVVGRLAASLGRA